MILELIDQRGVIEIVDQRPTVEVAAVGIQGPPGKDADNVIVSDTPPINPSLNDIWVRPNA